MRTYLENDILDPLLVQKRQLVQALRLGRINLVGQLGRAGEPLHAVALALRESDFTVQLGKTEAVHRADMRQDSSAPMAGQGNGSIPLSQFRPLRV